MSDNIQNRIEKDGTKYFDSDSDKHWSRVMSDPIYERRLLPWERSEVPTLSKHASTLESLETHQEMKRLIQRGRLWFFAMGTVRSWRSVWSSKLGKGLIVAAVLIGYEANAWQYLQAQQYKADTVQADMFFRKDDTSLTLIWPWGISERVDDVVTRHDRQVHLHYMAQTMSWDIPKYDAERYYSDRNVVFGPSDSKALSYFSTGYLSKLEEQMRQSLLLQDMVKDMEARAHEIGWEIRERGPYLETARLQDLYESVKESERLHPLALELIERGKRIDWDVLEMIERYPYTEDNIRLRSQEMNESERLHQTMLQFIRRAECSGWASGVESLTTPPYSEDNRAALEKHIENGTACYRPPRTSSGSYHEPDWFEYGKQRVKDAAKDAARSAKDAAKSAKDAAKSVFNGLKSSF